jgi:hypothetical protein
MKKLLVILAAIATVIFISGCSESKESESEPEASGQETREEISTRNRSVASIIPKVTVASSLTAKYWYECDYYGNCWDSDGYTWASCYYNSFDTDCEEGNYWFETIPAEEIAQPESITANYACCDSWGGCYDDLGTYYDDPIFDVADYCDECGNCYDYYGNYVRNDPSLVDEYYCSQYYQYEWVDSWDSCGNSYDINGEFMFYDNLYYNFESCNDDYSTCDIEAFGGPDSITENECDSFGNCYDETGEAHDDPIWMVADYCDECGNCYDYYGNYVNYDANLADDYWCSQYYQYENVVSWDSCGNAYDENNNFLFYDNEYYDYLACDQLTAY